MIVTTTYPITLYVDFLGRTHRGTEELRGSIPLLHLSKHTHGVISMRGSIIKYIIRSVLPLSRTQLGMENGLYFEPKPLRAPSRDWEYVTVRRLNTGMLTGEITNHRKHLGSTFTNAMELSSCWLFCSGQLEVAAIS